MSLLVQHSVIALGYLVLREKYIQSVHVPNLWALMCQERLG